ncbi:outer membrane protein assembly factor BamB [Xylophilus sp. GOD-11R]|uniref:outer membrane protein assembly factor BamB n=1 Tax=Xylophilus sp. GOD-11R TaxID=3089814 RepID=UPI00399B104C
MTFSSSLRPYALVAVTAAMIGLGGCSILPESMRTMFGGTPPPKPAELGPVVAKVAVRQAWTAKIPATGSFPVALQVNGDKVTLGADNGTVVSFEARTGRELWRASAGAPLSAGVGSDGNLTAVVTRNNELVAFSGGREAWRQALTAEAFTAPFVAGERVFVLAADRSVIAFDGKTGRRLWIQQRTGDPLVLRHGGALLAVGDTLVVGLAGRLVGMNPINGSTRWEAPVAVTRGTNDIERLVDIVGRTARDDSIVCARAFQSTVGCVDASRGQLLWARPAAGFTGLDGDESRLYGTESNGNVVAWNRADGERSWNIETLRYRHLSAPLVLGRSVAIGDDFGLVHMLSREDGSPVNRLTTDGSAITAAPVVAGDTLIVVTAKGGVYGFVPD